MEHSAESPLVTVKDGSASGLLARRVARLTLMFLTAVLSSSVHVTARPGRVLRGIDAYHQGGYATPGTGLPYIQPYIQPYNQPYQPQQYNTGSPPTSSTTSYSNPCSTNPCRYGGICRPAGISFTCQCQYGYSGTTCEIVNACIINTPCLNGARCQPTGSTFYCSCLYGYSGVHCEYRDACLVANPCRNGGQCISTGPGSGWYCRCLPGYSGPQCDLYDACIMSNPCLNGGQCQPQGRGYFCICRVGFQGQRCEIPVSARSAPLYLG